MKLDVDNWKEFMLGNLFDKMYKAEAHVKAEFDFQDLPSEKTIRFISRTELNNGCDCYVLNDGITGIEEGNAIAIGDTTATCSFQSEPFVCGDHMVICRASWINLYTAIFIITILKKEKYKYSYGRAFKMDLISSTIVKLPATKEDTPDWKFMEDYIKSLKHKPITTKNNGGYASHTLGFGNWKEYSIGDIFNIYNGRGITKEEIEDNPGNFVAVQSGEEDNGRIGMIDFDYCIEQKYIYSIEPCLTVARTGSAGYVSYHPTGCVVGDSAKILKLKQQEKANQYTYLFLRTILMANKYKYTYGRKVTEDKYLQEKYCYHMIQ